MQVKTHVSRYGPQFPTAVAVPVAPEHFFTEFEVAEREVYFSTRNWQLREGEFRSRTKLMCYAMQHSFGLQWLLQLRENNFHFGM